MSRKKIGFNDVLCSTDLGQGLMLAVVNTVVESEDRIKKWGISLLASQGLCFMEFMKLSLRAQRTYRHVLKHHGVLNLRTIVTDTKQVQQQRNNVIIEMCSVLLRDMHANRAEALQSEIRLF
jgi:hypothetical protein